MDVTMSVGRVEPDDGAVSQTNADISHHVLIIGAGISGLAAAQGLKKAGIPYTIFEAEEQATYRPREWTMALHWSIPMLRELLPDAVADRLQSTAVDPSLDYTRPPNNTVKMIDGVTGNVFKEIEVEGDFLRVTRRKLRVLCADGIDIQWGHVLEDINISDRVEAIFKNGKRYTGTVILGADGSRSFVRQYLLGDKAASTPLGMGYMNISFALGDTHKALFVRSAHPVNSFAVHPDCAILLSVTDVPDPEKSETWKFQVAMCFANPDDNMSNAEKLATVRYLSRNVCEPFKSAGEWIPEDTEIDFSPLGYWAAERFDSQGGKITLAGDAAHSMPPNRGQGCNHAINDALNFVRAVKGIAAGAKQGIIQAYSDEVVDRGLLETLLSKDTAE